MVTHPLYFVHPTFDLAVHATPKVAATSIRNAMLASIGVHVPAVADEQREAWPYMHPKPPQGHYVVATVRDPIDRIASVWADKVMGDGRMPAGLREAGVVKKMSFLDFLLIIRKLCPNDPHVQSQGTLLGDVKPDMIIKYEELDSGWMRLRQRYLLPPLVQSNATPSRLKRKALASEECRVIAAVVYEEDRWRFGYRAW